MHRQDVLRLVHVGLYLLTQAGDVVVHRSGRWVGVVAPYLVEQLVTGNHVTLLHHQVTQKPVLAS